MPIPNLSLDVPVRLAADPAITGLVGGETYWNTARNVLRLFDAVRWVDFEATQIRHANADLTTTVLSTTGADLFGFAVDANAVYSLDFYGVQSASVVGATPRYAVGGGGASSVAATVDGAVQMWTSATASTTTIVTASNTYAGTNVGTAATNFAVQGHWRVVPTASGQLQLRWGVAAAGTGTLRRGAYAILTRMQ